MYTRLIISSFVLLLSACSSIPLSSLYKLYKFDVLDIEPEELKVALRVDERLEVNTVTFKLGLANDGEVFVAKKFELVITKNPVLTPDLLDDKEPNESVTILQLNEEDAKWLKGKFAEANVSKFHQVQIDFKPGLCKNAELPTSGFELDLLMQPSIEDGYFYFIKDLELTKSREKQNYDAEEFQNGIEFCEATTN